MSEKSFVTRLEERGPEGDIAKDMVKRGLLVAPLLLAICGLFWQLDGVISAGYAFAIVLANFALAAAAMTITARISLALMMGVALFGYIIRLALILVAYLIVRNMGWFSPPAFGLSIIASHLGLLFWEVTQVSATLAFPGLKPGSPRRSTTTP